MNPKIKTLLKEARRVQKVRKHSGKRCPDQLAGVIKYNYRNRFEWIEKVAIKNKAGYLRKDINKKYERQNGKAIVMILESPHIDEYDNSMPIGPAYGRTGSNINNKFIHILNDAVKKKIFKILKLDTSSKYDFILVNAIQYQTSLGVETQIYRDAVFLYLWECRLVRKNFSSRLSEIIDLYKKENIILINCCTKGYHLDLVTSKSGKIDNDYIKELNCNFDCDGEPSLKQLVGHEIDSLNIVQYYAHHPASWDKDENFEWGIRLSMLPDKKKKLKRRKN